MRRLRRIEDRSRRTIPTRTNSDIGCLLGELTELDGDGHPLVDWPGNPRGPVAALTLADPPGTPRRGTPVLLAFPADSDRPVVLGFPRETVHETTPIPSVAHVDTPQALVINVERLAVAARRDIELRCGDGVITIRADGTVAVRGVRVVSQATELNRIRGAAVKIN